MASRIRPVRLDDDVSLFTRGLLDKSEGLLEDGSVLASSGTLVNGVIVSSLAGELKATASADEFCCGGEGGALVVSTVLADSLELERLLVKGLISVIVDGDVSAIASVGLGLVVEDKALCDEVETGTVD